MPVVVTRQNKESVVIISMKDYRAMGETAYLMQSEANAKRLNRSIAQLEAGLGKRELIEECYLYLFHLNIHSHWGQWERW